MRIAFVTTDTDWIQDEDGDRPFHEAAFADRSMTLEQTVWSDGSVDWASYDLVVIRSPWDYPIRTPEFLAWLDRVAPLPTLHNPAPLIRWNLDKRYLAELEKHGVPVVRTRYVEDVGEVAQALEGFEGAELVVKPVVSAGSRDTGRFLAGDPAALELAGNILAKGGVVMLQPFISSVAEQGETGLVCFDGVLSHGFRKGPLLERGGGLLGGRYREDITPRAPSAEQRRVAEAADGAVSRICAERLGVHRPLLYSRFDLVRLDDGSEAILEAELFEPAFFLAVDAAAAGRFADAVLARAAASVARVPA